MNIKLSWENFKACKDGNPNKTIFYNIENSYSSNDESIQNTDLYYLSFSIGQDDLICFIEIEDPPSEDQKEWEDNYKANAIIRN